MTADRVPGAADPTRPAPGAGPELRVVDDPGEYRVPPHDIQAEQCTLGAMLLSPHAVDDVLAEGLTSAQFYRPAHQIVFEAIARLHRDGQAVDAVTVAAELQRSGDLDRCGGAPYLHTLLAAPPAAASATHYARIVQGTHRLRRLIVEGTRLIDLGYSGDYERADDLLAEAQTRLLAEELGPDPGPTSILDVIDDVAEWADRDPGTVPEGLVPTPYSDLNELLDGGLLPGQVITIGARPSVGKSVMALDLARHAAIQHGIPAYLASLEMSRREMGMRLMAAEGRIPLSAIKRAAMTEEHWDRYARARARIAEGAHLELAHVPHATVDTIRAEVQRMARRPGVGRAGLVIVDYMQLLTPRPSGRGRTTSENRQTEVAEISRQIKLLAQQLAVPIVVLSQLNRAPETRADKRPAMADMRESGAIEQDADIVVLLHREELYDPETRNAGEAELIVAKNRNGATGSVKVAFQGHYSRFADMAPAHLHHGPQ